MRVCLINLWDQGGMLHYATQLANALARQSGLVVSLVLPRSISSDSLALIDPAVHIESLNVPTTASFRQVLQLPRQLRDFRRFFAVIDRLHPDIVHITAAHVWLILAVSHLKRRYRVISTLHDVVPHPGADDTFRKRLEIRTLVQNSAALFVHGAALKDKVLADYPRLTAEQVRVIPHGDYAFFARWRTDRSSESATLLFFGRIRDYKGLPDLITAYALVLQAVPDARLIIAGEGSLNGVMDQLRLLPNCEVLNRYIGDEEVAGVFERASLVVCPYIEASQSGVIPIAYAFEKPVIATRVGCLPDLVDEGVTGLLVPPHRPHELAEAIVKLLRDNSLRTRLGQNGHRKMIEQLNWDRIAAVTRRVYQQLPDQNYSD